MNPDNALANPCFSEKFRSQGLRRSACNVYLKEYKYSQLNCVNCITHNLCVPLFPLLLYLSLSVPLPLVHTGRGVKQ